MNGGRHHNSPHSDVPGPADARRARLRELREINDTLRHDPIVAPDLTHAILQRLEHKQLFLDSRRRRAVVLGRLAVAASIGLTLLGVAVLHRLAPGVRVASDRDTPLTMVVDTVTEQGAARLQLAVESVRSAPLPPIDAASTPVQPIHASIASAVDPTNPDVFHPSDISFALADGAPFAHTLALPVEYPLAAVGGDPIEPSTPYHPTDPSTPPRLTFNSATTSISKHVLTGDPTSVFARSRITPADFAAHLPVGSTPRPLRRVVLPPLERSPGAEGQLILR